MLEKIKNLVKLLAKVDKKVPFEFIIFIIGSFVVIFIILYRFGLDGAIEIFDKLF